MAHHPRPIRPELYFLKPRLPPDDDGVMPAWGLAHRGKLNKNGRGNFQFVWPRDKGEQNSPRTSWRRWKDVFTGKGPGIWITREGDLTPHRPLWSNWVDAALDGKGFDNLGYRDNRDEFREPIPHHIKYDFRTRKYRPFHMNMLSDVKWERGRHPIVPLYTRDAIGVEEVHIDQANPWHNPFAYNENTPYWDWARPSPNDYYYNHYMQGAAHPHHPI